MTDPTVEHDAAGPQVHTRAPAEIVLALGALVLALLALTSIVGLGRVGWLAGLATGLLVTTTLAGGLRRRHSAEGLRGLGPADRVTLARAMLTCAVAGLLATALTGWPDASPDQAQLGRVLVVAVSTVALVLDYVDGRVARRTGTASALGARFDMEVDALLLLVLSAYVASSVGLWVLAIGLARYAFWGVRVLVPWLRGTAPPRPWCKVVAAIQGIVLVVVATGWLPDGLARAALVVALALLTESFAHEAWDVWRLRGTAPEPGPSAPRWLGPALACGLVWIALVAPAEIGALSTAAFLRIPVEGVLLLGLLLVLPLRASRRTALIAGLVLGILTVLKVLDLGVSVAFDRPFDPLGDPVHLGDGLGFLNDAMGTANAVTVGALLVLVMLGVLVGVPLAVVRTAALIRHHRPVAVAVVLALAIGWGLGAATGARVSTHLSLAASPELDLASTHVSAVRAELRDRAALAAAVAEDPYRDVPGSQLLTALRGKDVLLVFVESYGRVALEGLPTSEELVASVEEETERLRRAGYRSSSGWLTSPTFGAMSWLAHSTLQSGLWIDGQSTYDELLGYDRLTLSGAFAKAGWRTVGVVPANTEDWPDGPAFYRWQSLYDSRNVGYDGPRFGYARMPDQFALEAFRRLELDRPGRGPVMAEIDLESSHNPWVPLPRMVDPAVLGDGSVFDPMPAQGEQRDEVWRDPELVKAAYVRSLQYSLDALVSFVADSEDHDLVLVVLGDHQPVTTVSGTTSGRDVPISVVAHDPAVLRRIADWGWDEGLLPSPGAPVWPMDRFRDRFLAAYGPVSE